MPPADCNGDLETRLPAHTPCRGRPSRTAHSGAQNTHTTQPRAAHAPPPGPAKVGELSDKVATGVAIRKGESDPPLLPDDQYPEWLWGLLTPEPSTAELQRMYEKDGLTLAQVG